MVGILGTRVRPVNIYGLGFRDSLFVKIYHNMVWICLII